MWNSLSNINFYENLLDTKSKEKEKITESDVNISKLCRTCLREAPDTDNLLKDFEIGAMNINLDGKLLKMIDMLRESTGLQVEECDLLPHQICNNCIQNVSGAYFFRMQSHKAEKTLLKLITALSSEPDDSYENVQHLEESSRDGKHSVSTDDEEEENCELMEIEFDSIRYKIEADSDSTEIITDTIMTNEDIVEEQDCSESVEGVQIEYIDKTDDEEVKSLAEFVVEFDKDVQEKPHKSLSKCTECTESFALKKDLHEHIKNAHPTAKAFKCDICESRFSKIQTLKRHIKIHQDDQKNKLCTFCGKRFTRADDLKRHVRTHTNERPYACNLCPKRYKQTSELKEHMVTHSREKVYNCEICGKCLLTRNGHYIHMKVHAGVKNHKCKVCDKKFVTSGELNSHVRHIHDKERPFACTFENCERKFTTKLSLEIHRRAHTGERPFACPICGKKLASTSSLSDHVKIHTGEKRFFCKVCNKTFNSSASLKKHLPRHELNEAASNSVQDSFVCGACGLSFLHLEQLKEHEKMHDSDDPKMDDNSQKLSGNGEVDQTLEEEPSHSHLKQQIKDECQFLIVDIRDEDGVQEYLQS